MISVRPVETGVELWEHTQITGKIMTPFKQVGLAFALSLPQKQEANYSSDLHFSLLIYYQFMRQNPTSSTVNSIIQNYTAN